MYNVELPWIDGWESTGRWYPFIEMGPRDFQGLHHCIFELGLPIYYFDRELHEGIVDEEEVTFNDNGEPVSCYDKKHILYFFDTFVRYPEKFDPEDTFQSHALRKMRTKQR